MNKSKRIITILLITIISIITLTCFNGCTCIFNRLSKEDAQKYLVNKYKTSFEYNKDVSTSMYGSDMYYEFKDTKGNYLKVRGYKYSHCADNYYSYLYDEQIANFLNNQLGNNYYCQCDTKQFYHADSFSC